MEKREQRELARIGEVLAFLTADTCQAALLMEHFGETPDASFARTKGFGIDLPRGDGASVDADLWQELAAAAAGGALPRDNPRLLARFAFGYSSPRITALRLKQHALFGRFVGCSFEEIYERCAELCE